MFELHLFILASEFAFLSTKHFLSSLFHTQKYRPNLSASKTPLQVNIHYPPMQQNTHPHIHMPICTHEPPFAF